MMCLLSAEFRFLCADLGTCFGWFELFVLWLLDVFVLRFVFWAEAHSPIETRKNTKTHLTDRMATLQALATDITQPFG